MERDYPKCGEVTGRVAKSTGEPCRGPLFGGKCGTHDCADLPDRNARCNEAFKARIGPSRYARHMAFVGHGGSYSGPNLDTQRRQRAGMAVKYQKDAVPSEIVDERPEAVAAKRRAFPTDEERRAMAVLDALASPYERWHAGGPELADLVQFAWPFLDYEPAIGRSCAGKGLFLVASEGLVGMCYPGDLFVRGWWCEGVLAGPDLEEAVLDFVIRAGLAA